MLRLRRGRYVARQARDVADLQACQQLRFAAFRGGTDGMDCDHFDAMCTHIMVVDSRSGDLVSCFRLLPLDNGTEITSSYSAQFYELSALEAYPGKMVEMGRFCIAPGLNDPDILRVAWGALTHYVDDNAVEMLFGCASFQGTEGAGYEDAFALLSAKHLAPKRWLPRVKAPAVFPFSARLGMRKPDIKRAMQTLPPLLRTYLVMGGWVSDHAVVDQDLNTLHVFTGLEIGAIPPQRVRLLRATAG